MSEEVEVAPAAVPAKKSSRLLLFGGIGVAVIALGGGIFWWTSRRPTPAAEAPAKAESHGLVPFEAFVVNLADGGGSRFLRITLQLVINSPEAAEHVIKTPVLVMQGRSAILELLALQTSDTLVTPAGKAALKKIIAERAAAALDGAQVVDVLFSEFVVQF